MRRAGLALVLLAGCAAAGVLAAVVVASPGRLLALTTGTTLTGATTAITAPIATTAPEIARTTTTAVTTTARTTTARTTTTTAKTTTITKRPPTTTAAKKPPPRPPRRARPRPPRPVTIAKGVKVAGVRVGGLRPEAALRVVRAAFARPLELTLPGRKLRVPPRQFAVAYAKQAVDRARKAPPGSAVRLVVAVRGAAVRSYVGELGTLLDRPPADATLSLRGSQPWIAPEVEGRALERALATGAIVGALSRNSRLPIGLRLTEIEPDVTRESFDSVIVIRRGSNRLVLYDGMRERRVFGVATGQSAYPTPLGRFNIVVKWQNPWWYPPSSDWAKGQKPIPPGPGNPLGTRWMGISSPGVGIHGTNNESSIGYSVSHGCIRMHVAEAEWLFEHVEIGTTVFIVSS